VDIHKIYDVVIVGAGISGISSASHIETYCNNIKYIVLENRDDLGGTWDLFQYPGIRSDSDMHTMGLKLFPWPGKKFLADGPSIKDYLIKAVDHFKIRKNISFSKNVTSINWNDSDSLWYISLIDNNTNEKIQLRSKFIHSCAGYYRYSSGYKPEFKSCHKFNGLFIHPQEWRKSIDYKNKNVVVIGSGATAITLVPAMANEANHVTMIQRSPTYIASMDDEYKYLHHLSKISKKFAYWFIRFTNIIRQQWMYRQIRRWPEQSKEKILDLIKEELPKEYVDEHLTPNYYPWEQRLCIIPNNDLFKVINNNKASIVTDAIDEFYEDGVILRSGKKIEADIIISATGLVLENFGGMKILLDGVPINIGDTATYKSMMHSDIPNFLNTFGYINASWTLKADLTSKFLTRLINFMKKNSYQSCRPVIPKDMQLTDEWLSEFSSGYIQRARDIFPKQGNTKPWRNTQNYIIDWFEINYGKIKDKNLLFKK
jgi:monooxygenase